MLFIILFLLLCWSYTRLTDSPTLYSGVYMYKRLIIQVKVWKYIFTYICVCMNVHMHHHADEPGLYQWLECVHLDILLVLRVVLMFFELFLVCLNRLRNKRIFWQIVQTWQKLYLEIKGETRALDFKVVAFKRIHKLYRQWMLQLWILRLQPTLVEVSLF